MALKRPHDMMAAFSMASMTDVIFLLLIFFMITSTFVFPTALDVNLPQSTVQTSLKPSTRIYIDSQCNIYASADNQEPMPIERFALGAFLQLAQQSAPKGSEYVALYADEQVPYGTIVEILDLGSRNNMHIVLATRPTKPTTIAR